MQPSRDPATVSGCDEGHSATPRDHALRHRALRWLVASALVVALSGAFGYVGWQRVQHYQKELAATQALAAAEKYATALINLDSKVMDDNIDDILDGSTGEFNDRFGKSHHLLRSVLLEHQTAALGHIVESAVKSVSTNKVEVLLLVNQSVSSQDAPFPEIDRSRIKMTMEKVDGRWLASKVELR